MIQAVIFDVGGVLIRTHDHSTRRAWEKRLGLAEWESEEIVFGSEMGTAAQAGQITDAALWAWVGQRLSLDADQLAAFQQDFWAGDVLDTELVALIRALRPGYQTAIISNATDNLHHALTHKFAIADAFDLIVGSAMEGVMKPHAAIYQLALARLGRQPAEAVFIDDSAVNISAAQALGMATIHFNPRVDVAAELARLGVRPAA